MLFLSSSPQAHLIFFLMFFGVFRHFIMLKCCFLQLSYCPLYLNSSVLWESLFLQLIKRMKESLYYSIPKMNTWFHICFSSSCSWISPSPSYVSVKRLRIEFFPIPMAVPQPTPSIVLNHRHKYFISKFYFTLKNLLWDIKLRLRLWI